ncbi:MULTISPECIES: hypothetical protein [unclassified Prochlorococcus]|uniref:hypothetical protein n=1 Tax=unclassified Prochlorococcus TaxID=2627481 RepID=UPI0039A50E35
MTYQRLLLVLLLQRLVLLLQQLEPRLVLLLQQLDQSHVLRAMRQKQRLSVALLQRKLLVPKWGILVLMWLRDLMPTKQQLSLRMLLLE